MSPAAVLRAVGARVWRPTVAAVLVGGLSTVAGMAVGAAVVLAAGAAALVVVAEHLDLRTEPAPERHRATRRDGSRGEVLDLAWSMVGRDGRAGERSLRRLRAAAARRLARHGLDLADAADAEAVRALVGPRAHATLTRTTHPLPSLGDLQHTLTVLEGLGTDRRTTGTARSS
ncbi:hypothetical protein [Cellulomonas oligotrophica]|uniref:Uncharacterized protein n=1 Tax=Cellulomonas oligotrophica TaxID=931536 RepID=A0A7Y9FFR8_9CELL|nr:hypothetical protein [Cellulomonas oligotrophica]NYD86429.1 hypothetical protein [Cellulomonas oligotrophica]GIG32680.1 hypothetical protein Col01nite_18390 [Cellulomonas oligotrophica]